MHQSVRRIIWGILCLLLLAGCAEVTRPQPTAKEHEDLQLAAARRHPAQSWAAERTSRVFLRLLSRVPQVHGHTYPFLGFNWWITARERLVIDRVWRPSPAHDVGLKPGDVILAAHNWPLALWIPAGDRYLQSISGVFGGSLPGELLVSLLLAVKYVRMDLREQYLSGPVELLIEREKEKRPVTLYPQHLPANYAILVANSSRVANDLNAWAAPGRIIVSRRYVNFCRTDDELALAVGHELAHQVLGHRVRRAGQRHLTLPLEAAAAFTTYTLTYLLRLWYVPVFDKNILAEVPKAAVSVFSRGDEREADAYGMWYAYQAGYDIKGALAVYERLATVVEKDPFYHTAFLDSHPASLERMARMKKIARCFEAGQAAQVFLQSPNLDRQAANN